MVIEREYVKMSPNEAVADAVMVAIYRQLNRQGGIEAWTNNKASFGKAIPYDLAFITRLATKGGCRGACDHVITFLGEKYGNLFSKLVLIEALSSADYLLTNGWGWHDYFLALGIDGVWYAGSPANYQDGMEDVVGDMLKIISSRSLDQVMSEIAELEGGLWPEPVEIKKILSEPLEKSDDSVPIIYNQSGDTLFRWYKRPVKTATAVDKKK